MLATAQNQFMGGIPVVDLAGSAAELASRSSSKTHINKQSLSS